ncbi:hypothetical protein MFLAVUS_009610 [Mucor flavus]|uniref:Uncharacterized protein n=1 Tax=Mucor flavus TaxID=439312 RepID=A0ABP9ZAD6_9FUNG
MSINDQLTYDPMKDVMSTIDDPNLETLPAKVASKRTNADYSINQRTTFIDRMTELHVGRELGIEERTAQRWWRNYEEIGLI